MRAFEWNSFETPIQVLLPVHTPGGSQVSALLPPFIKWEGITRMVPNFAKSNRKRMVNDWPA